MLVDEHDAPLLGVMHDPERLERHREIMREFCSPLKVNEAKLAFVLLTGISKFSQLSIYKRQVKDTTQCKQYRADKLVSLGLASSTTKSMITSNAGSHTELYVQPSVLGMRFCRLAKA